MQCMRASQRGSLCRVETCLLLTSFWRVHNCRAVRLSQIRYGAFVLQLPLRAGGPLIVKGRTTAEDVQHGLLSGGPRNGGQGPGAKLHCMRVLVIWVG